MTLALGLGSILILEALVFLDVVMRGWAVAPYEALAAPRNTAQAVGRWVAHDVTPLCWVAYVVMLDGLLSRPSRNAAADGSPVRRRPRRFGLCVLASVALWLMFDWVNFSFLDAWRYHGLPENTGHRLLGYFFAFGAIFPAMFLTAELLQRLGLSRVRYRPLRLTFPIEAFCVAFGLVALAFPLLVRDPVGTVGLWLGWFFLLDPINRWLGAPSLLRDWRQGRWGRTLALLAAGAICGLLWEFWNYWAATKWTYHLPFLGPLEDYRYFEMPVIGLSGFLPFALECWAMFQTLLFLLGRLGRRIAEPLPDEARVI